MKRKTINTIEEYLLQVLSMNKELTSDGTSLATFIVEEDEHGNPKLNDKN